MTHRHRTITTILSLALLTLGIILGLILVDQNQDIRRSASGATGQAIITISPTATIIPNSPAVIDISVNTQFDQVVGFQIHADLSGTIPTNLDLQPAVITGLELVAHSLTSTSTGTKLTLAYLAGPDSLDSNLLVPYSTSNQTVKLASLTFTAPTSGNMTLTFDRPSSAIISVTEDVDIAQLPPASIYTFSDPASPSPFTQSASTTSPTPIITPTPANPLPATTTPTPIDSLPTLETLTITTQFAGVNSDAGPIPAQISLGTTGSSSPIHTLNTVFTYQNQVYQTTINTRTYSIPITNPVWIGIKGEKHLRRVFIDLTLTPNYILNATAKPQLPGDVAPQDGLANTTDINLIFAGVSKPVQDSQTINIADLNYDGFINSIDSSLFITTLDAHSDEQP